MIIADAFDADELIEFLGALMQDANRKFFLILDKHGVHHSKLVKAWDVKRIDQIELFCLPSYSPHLNSERRLNADLKQAMKERFPLRTMSKLRDEVNEHTHMHMHMLERTLARPHARSATSKADACALRLDTSSGRSNGCLSNQKCCDLDASDQFSTTFTEFVTHVQSAFDVIGPFVHSSCIAGMRFCGSAQSNEHCDCAHRVFAETCGGGLCRHVPSAMRGERSGGQL
jgi:DDE superfamily endonuclease